MPLTKVPRKMKYLKINLSKWKTSTMRTTVLWKRKSKRTSENESCALFLDKQNQKQTQSKLWQRSLQSGENYPKMHTQSEQQKQSWVQRAEQEVAASQAWSYITVQSYGDWTGWYLRRNTSEHQGNRTQAPETTPRTFGCLVSEQGPEHTLEERQPLG